MANTNVPKFSGTWWGSRFSTQVGCQHIGIDQIDRGESIDEEEMDARVARMLQS